MGVSADQAGKSPRPRGVGEASLAERAAVAASAELRGERTRILGARGRSGAAPLAPPRRVPDRWSFVHVMDRMEEAFRTLGRLPTHTRPRGYMNSMPVYLYDRGDLNAQLETHELERMAMIRNHVRIRPSPAEIERVAGELGFEPRLTESESAVLPLNYSPKPLRHRSFSRSAKVLSLFLASGILAPVVAST